MDSLSADPVCYSSLEAAELDDSGNEGEQGVESEELPEEGEDDEDGEDLKERLVQPRFEAWLAGFEGAKRGLLLELYSRLEVLEHGVVFDSSAQSLRVEFLIAGMRGIYLQRSMVDAESDAWDMSPDGRRLELVPNITALLELDEETLVDCQQFTGQGASVGSSIRTVDEDRISDRFGSDTLVQLGGLDVLLQFFGTVCGDASAPPEYTLVLPFGGLSEAVLQLVGADNAKQRKAEQGVGVQRQKKKVAYKPPTRAPASSAPKPRPPEKPKPKSRSSSQSRGKT